jgi:phosphotransferase system enzyme I (PtsI)
MPMAPIDPHSETRLRGLPISRGVVLARTCQFRMGCTDDVPDYRVSGPGVDVERARLLVAMGDVGRQLQRLKAAAAERIGPAEAEIFAVQEAILNDPALERDVARLIDDGYNAESAVLRTFERFEQRLRQVDNAYLSERVSDLAEVKNRLLGTLCSTGPAFQCAGEPQCQRGRQRIVITEELTPSLALELDHDEILGIVTERGGATSHAAILARALGIPAVSGIPSIHDRVACGTEMILNGDTGEIIVWPTPQTVLALGIQPTVALPREDVADPVPAIQVLANIGLASDVAEARKAKAEGIGLYRTEMEFFAAGRLLSEDEQYERYRSVIDAMGGRPVVFRMLDIGGDKPAPMFEVAPEDNPQLGLRGTRYLLSRPDLVRTQARALVRAARHGPVHVMYPMIVSRDQFVRIRAVFTEAVADLPAAEVVHGVMFEVPSAVLDAQGILEEAEFGSVGSNDLVQFLFAVDRNNERVSADYLPDHGVFWRVLAQLACDAQAAARPLSICGEMASDPEYTPRLLSLGIRTVSVSPRLIAGVRRAAGTSPREETSPCRSAPASSPSKAGP